MILITFISLSISSLFINDVDSAKILYFYYIGCKSTASMHQAISKILLDNHHEIIAISPYPLGENLANYTDLGVHDEIYKFSDQFSMEDEMTGTYVSRKLGYQVQMSNCENLYRNAKIVETLKNIHLDLILLEIDNAECFFPMLAPLNVPIIGVSTQNILFPDFDSSMGNPTNPSYIPTSMSGFSTQMDFFQRLHNVKDYLLHSIIAWYYTNEAADIVAKYLKRPPAEELFDRMSLVFTNGHFSFLPKPMAPTTVDIAGIHIGKPSPLPKEIQTFIDGSTEGVIYLSFGSVVAFSRLPKHIHDSFVKELQKSPYRVIWRHDKPEMVSNTSKNILVQKWLPQKDILAHPKVILFISHSGIFSTYESIHFGVPILAFPVLYDQFTNAAIIQNLEIGITLDWRNFNEKSFILGMEEILKNNKYRENMKKLFSVFKDRPLSPQDTLIYWVNYVLRHKDVSYLKPVGTKLPFFQYLLLDVILFLTLTLISASWIIYSTLKMTTSLFKKLLIKKSTITKTKLS